MVKNEAARISYTIKSCCHPSISGLVIYDTGSTDDTLEVIKNTAKTLSNIKHIDIIKGEFQDFATSRNKNLAFAQECALKYNYEYFFLLDSNDELIFEDDNFDTTLFDPDVVVWLVKCEWKIKEGIEPITFRNTKFVRAKIPEFQWVGVVHEYLSIAPHQKRDLCNFVRVFQDRMKDNDGKTKDRWTRDRILLEREHEKNENDLRTLFYLAQTYSCLGEYELAYNHYAKRTLHTNEGFYEEQFCSLYRCGEIACILNLPDEIALSWYTRAFIHSERAEPLVAIAEMYEKIKQYKLAYAFISLACILQLPEHSLLFVDKDCYSYKRWHVLGRIAWYATSTIAHQHQKEDIIKNGLFGCLKAIEAKGLDVDKNNIIFYQDASKNFLTNTK